MKKKFTNQEILDMIPVKNQEVKQENNKETEETLLTLERKKIWWLNILSMIFMLPKEKTIALDKTGTAIYNMCSGSNTIKSIINNFKNNSKNENHQKIEKAVISYLNQLARKRIIGFATSPSKSKEKNA